jgi:hypothetical protein
MKRELEMKRRQAVIDKLTKESDHVVNLAKE